MRYRVIVRVRPPLGPEVHTSPVVEVLDESKLRVFRECREPLLLKFDSVLGSESVQSDVFESILDVVTAATNGQSGTILAYGQTGSGKTHTMSGDLSKLNGMGHVHPGVFPMSESRGLVPRTLEHLFHVVATQSGVFWRVCVSFLEIYNEKVYDLLVEPRTGSTDVCAWDRQGRYAIDEGRLDVRENADGTTYVPGATMVEVRSCEQAQDVLRVGTLSRTVGDNGVNPMSSRSHAIFQIALERQFTCEVSGTLLQNTKLNLVDLAGSEKFHSDTSIAVPLLQELTCINHALSTLGQCISALVERRTHIPCRNSKLTRLLQDSLKGSSLTAMCICISPAASALEETLNSLRFADRAKRAVIERPSPHNTSSSGGGNRCQVVSLMARVRDLKDKLTTERHERMRLQHLLSVADAEFASIDQSEPLSFRDPSVSPGICLDWESSITPCSSRAASAPSKQRSNEAPSQRCDESDDLEAPASTIGTCPSVVPQASAIAPRSSTPEAISPFMDAPVGAVGSPSCDETSSIRGSEEHGGSSASTSVDTSAKTKEKAYQSEVLENVCSLLEDACREDTAFTEVPCHTDNAGHPTGCSDDGIDLRVSNQCETEPQAFSSSAPNYASSTASSGFETCRESESMLPTSIVSEYANLQIRSRQPSPGELPASGNLLWPKDNLAGPIGLHVGSEKLALDRLRVASLDPELSATDLRLLIAETLDGFGASAEFATIRRNAPDLESCDVLAHRDPVSERTPSPSASSGEADVAPDTSVALGSSVGHSPDRKFANNVLAESKPEEVQPDSIKMMDMSSQCKDVRILEGKIGASVAKSSRSKQPSYVEPDSKTSRQNCPIRFPSADQIRREMHRPHDNVQHDFQKHAFLAAARVSTLAREHDSSLAGAPVFETSISDQERHPKPSRRWKKTTRNSDITVPSPISSVAAPNLNASRDLTMPSKTKAARSESIAWASSMLGSTASVATSPNSQSLVSRKVSHGLRKVPALKANPIVMSPVTHSQEESHLSVSLPQSRHASRKIAATASEHQDGSSGTTFLPSQRISPGSYLGGATAARAGEQLRRQKELLRRGREDRARRRSEEREGITDSSAERLHAIISENIAGWSGRDSMTSSAERLPGFASGISVGQASHCWQEVEGAFNKASPRQV